MFSTLHAPGSGVGEYVGVVVGDVVGLVVGGSVGVMVGANVGVVVGANNNNKQHNTSISQEHYTRRYPKKCDAALLCVLPRVGARVGVVVGGVVGDNVGDNVGGVVGAVLLLHMRQRTATCRVRGSLTRGWGRRGG